MLTDGVALGPLGVLSQLESFISFFIVRDQLQKNEYLINISKFLKLIYFLGSNFDKTTFTGIDHLFWNQRRKIHFEISQGLPDKALQTSCGSQSTPVGKRWYTVNGSESQL